MSYWLSRLRRESLTNHCSKAIGVHIKLNPRDGGGEHNFMIAHGKTLSHKVGHGRQFYVTNGISETPFRLPRVTAGDNNLVFGDSSGGCKLVRS